MIFSNQDKETIRANLNSALTVDGLKALNLAIPPKQNGQPSDFADKHVAMVARSARPSYFEGPDGPGFHVWFDSGVNGVTTQAEIIDKNGHRIPLFIPVNKVLVPHTGVIDKAINTIKTFIPDFSRSPRISNEPRL